MVTLLFASEIVGCLWSAWIYIDNDDYDQGSTVPLPPRLVGITYGRLKAFFAQDLLVNELYRGTVVLAVNRTSQAIAWLDRVIIDGAVNLVGSASIFSGNLLKYTVTGQSQQYVLTILVGILIVTFAAFVSLPS